MPRNFFLQFLEEWEKNHRILPDTSKFAKIVRNKLDAIDAWLAEDRGPLPDDCWETWRSFLGALGLTIEKHPLMIQPKECRVLDAGVFAGQVYAMAKAAKTS